MTNRTPSDKGKTPSAPLQVVMFHVFGAPDRAAEKQIALAAHSIRLHYPEAEIILLTNDVGEAATLPDYVARKSGAVDFDQLMFERTRRYRDHVHAVAPGTRIVFLDTDMLVIRRFDELLTPGADLSFTVRQIAPAPINGGLIVVDTARYDRVTAFFDQFVACLAELPDIEKRWDGDQIALKLLLDPPVSRLREIVVVEHDGLVVRLAPAQVFNHTPRRLMLKLGLFRPGARILHFKGGRKLRMAAYAARYLSSGPIALARFGGRMRRPYKAD